jgi:tRNA threonylcarbamoyl adenosine modification protein YeaZ
MTATLVIDTAGLRCAAAVVIDGAIRAEQVEQMTRGHAERLFPLIGRVLAQARTGPTHLGLIVVCTGPGGFTGARIGVAAARGLSLALGIPAAGVSWFEAIASGAGANEVAVVLPAPPGALFVQYFRGEAPLAAPAPLPAGDTRRNLPQFGAEALDGTGLADLARAALLRDEHAPPTPLYLRPPDAQPARTRAPRLLG